jgi:hypothetical protein
MVGMFGVAEIFRNVLVQDSKIAPAWRKSLTLLRSCQTSAWSFACESATAAWIE